MLDNIEQILAKLADIGAKDLPLVQQIINDIKSEFGTKLATASPEGAIIPSGLQFWRKFTKGVLSRHLVYEITSTGLVTSAQAQTMVDVGSQIPGPFSPPVVKGEARIGAATGIFSNIVTWIEQNLPQLLQTFITIAPLIMTLLAAFGA